MRQILFGFVTLSYVLICAPFAVAMQATDGPQVQIRIDETSPIVIENLCDPNFNAEVQQETIALGLDFQQVERVRIELLERGFDPGFDPARNTTIDTQFRAALAKFQLEYRLPATGAIDSATLDALSVPKENDSPTILAKLAQHAKPSR
jgi:hypothetical protein